MKCEPIESAGLRVLQVDQFYDPDELVSVKAEATKLLQFAREPELAGAAPGRKRGRALVLDRFYRDIVKKP